MSRRTEPENFRDWINKIGVEELAQKLGVAESTVRHWRVGRSIPHAWVVLEIEKMSRGAITFRTIAEHARNFGGLQ